MTDLTVTYFDLSGSRGEEVRLALTLAAVPFTDNRVDRADFAALKPDIPFGALPLLSVAGQGDFSQSNAILRLIGRRHGLYPDDIWEAARHDALMEASEDLRHKISPTMRMTDPVARTAARQQLVAGYLPQWGQSVELLIGDGPFVGGAEPGVADIKLYMVHRWISAGGVDDIPADIFDGLPRLTALTRAMAALHTGARK
jgi:glutathione S-transferase